MWRYVCIRARLFEREAREYSTHSTLSLFFSEIVCRYSSITPLFYSLSSSSKSSVDVLQAILFFFMEYVHTHTHSNTGLVNRIEDTLDYDPDALELGLEILWALFRNEDDASERSASNLVLSKFVKYGGIERILENLTHGERLTDRGSGCKSCDFARYFFRKRGQSCDEKES